MTLKDSVPLRELLMVLTHDIMNLADHVQFAKPDDDYWWLELDRRLQTIELWRKSLIADDIEVVDCAKID